jgi:hypothetical protein
VNIKSNSAFMRGEGVWSAVKRVMAEVSACLRSTNLFHHRGNRSALFGKDSAARKTRKGRMGET